MTSFHSAVGGGLTDLLFFGWFAGTIVIALVAVSAMLVGLAFAGAIGGAWRGVALAAQGAKRWALSRGAGGSGLEPETPLAVPEASSATSVGVNEVARADIFQGLTASQLQELSALGRRATAPAEKMLVGADEPVTALYVILSGKVELYARSTVGDVTMRLAGSGESFPLAALIGTGQLITSARAMTDLELWAIPVAEFRALCARKPEIASQVYHNVACVLAERYRVTLDRMIRAAHQAMRGVDVWSRIFGWPGGIAATRFAHITPDWWESIASLPEGDRRGELRSLCESLVALDQPTRLAMVEEMIGGEMALPNEEQTLVTRSRISTWLDLEPSRARVVAGSYGEAMWLMPESIAVRQRAAVREIRAGMTEERREKLDWLIDDGASR